MLKDQNIVPRKNIAVICFASEESARFGVSTIGSKAIAGMIADENIAQVTDQHGTTIQQAVEGMGLKSDEMEKAEVGTDKIEQFVELHIEQGRRLQDENKHIGIVNGIARPTRFIITAAGMANHTGTTPMMMRQDALAAIAPLIVYVNEEAKKTDSVGKTPFVATVSTVRVEPNAMNIIPGEATIGIDIRSVDHSLKKDFTEKITDYCVQLEKEHGVSITIHTLVDNHSITLDEHVRNKLMAASEQKGLSYMVMDSGAGHDVMNMATKWPSGLIFIPCKDGVSHNPKEYTSTGNLLNGARVLEQFLRMEG